MIKIEDVKQLRGRIDFAIMTIREDEFEAVLSRFVPQSTLIGGKHVYEFCRIRRPDGRTAAVAVARTFEQGQNVAQSVARDVIDDLMPRWLILAGIAGGIADNEFSLGDVLLASSLHDFSISAAIESQQPQIRPAGGPVHPAVERLIAHLPAYRNRLGDWNREQALGIRKPSLTVLSDINADCYYGLDENRERVRDSLQRHFPSSGFVRPPLYKIGALATANVLLKDTTMLRAWKTSARHITHIEMEAGGVYMAARHAHPHEIPLLCVRGISDIVGFERDPVWTAFACAAAASFLRAILTEVPLELYYTGQEHRVGIPRRVLSRLPLVLQWVLNSSREAVTLALSQLSDLFSLHGEKVPTFDAIIDAFRNSATPFLRRVVDASDRILRAELQQLEATLSSQSTDPHVVCLLGSPGSGKTALLALFVQQAIGAGVPTIAIKADLVPREVPFEAWVARELGLNLSVLETIKTVASRSTVLVVVDQLDALASTVDLTSNRLNDILAFIAACASIRKVIVVCSCRTFDFHHDTRFGALEAKTIELTLPTWTDIESQLTKHGVADSARWPDTFKEVLRTPQHLHVFLNRVAATGNVDSFGSYHAMLDDFWDRYVQALSERALLDELIEFLVNDESLWAPLVRFEEHRESIKSLEAKGFLQVENGRLGFRHQSLFEHGKARLFTKRDSSLSRYVLERQDAIFVRPTVWSVLRYLRDVHPEKYRSELESMFGASLRLHLRYLLIDLLGQIANPADYEIVCLSQSLMSNEDRVRALLAIRGNEKWFHAFKASHFPIIMRGPPESQWAMIAVIGDAWATTRDICLDMIQEFWFHDPAKDGLTFRAMSRLAKWDLRAVDLVCMLIRRADTSAERLHWAETLVSTISADQPELAPRVFAETVALYARGAASSHEHRRDSPLESTRGWYDLPAVAEAAPAEFLRLSWEWLVRTCEAFHADGGYNLLDRYSGFCLSFDERHGRPDVPIRSAFFAAIDAVAQNMPDEYLRITRPSWESQNAVVHRFLIRGLALAVRTLPQSGLEYLKGDRRRFAVGTHESHSQSDSIALIRALALGLAVDEREGLEELILSSSMYRAGIGLDDEQREWDREARLRLLVAIPTEYLSPKALKFMQREKLSLPNGDQPALRSRAGFVRQIPPISKEEMATASYDEIENAIRTSRERRGGPRRMVEVDGGWEELGGPQSTGPEIAELAKSHPQKAVEIIIALVGNGEEGIAATASHGLAETSLTDEEVFAFSRAIALLHPQSEQLRSSVAYVLYRRSKEGVGLPDDVCDVLAHWLAQPWHSHTPDVFQLVPDRSNPVASVLWADGMGLLDADQSFWPLVAISQGYLLRSPPETTKWLDIIEQHLNRDISGRTWAAYCSELQWIRLKGCDLPRGVAVVRRVFDRFPDLHRQTEGIRLVALISGLLPQDILTDVLGSLRATGDFACQQAYGEVLTLIAFRDTNHPWARAMFDRELAAINGHHGITEPIAVGIAFVAARLWDEPGTRTEAASILARLVPISTETIGQAIASVFWAREDFAADDAAETLFQAYADNPGKLIGIGIVDLVEHLIALLPHKRMVVLRTSQAILNSGRQESDLFEAGPVLVKIAMTLQRFADTRSEGLSLLEGLLRLGLDDAFRVLHEIDMRPAARGESPLPRRRRRR